MPSAGVQFRTMEEILTYEEIILVCRAAALSGIRKIKITGGEPLVRKGIAQLIGKIAKIPGITEVTMTTNGIYLKELLPELLKNLMRSDGQVLCFCHVEPEPGVSDNL